MTGKRSGWTVALGILIVLVAVLLQEGMVSYIDIESVRPDIVLLLVINWSILSTPESGMLWGLAGGAFLDLFSGLPFGTSSAAYVAAAGVVTITERLYSRTHILLPVVAALVATVVYYLVSFFVVASIDHVFFLSSSFLATVAGVAIFNALLNPLLYWAMHNTETRMSPMARTIL